MIRTKKVAVTLNLLPRQALDILKEVDVTREEQRLLQQVILESWDAGTIAGLLSDPMAVRMSRLRILQGAAKVASFGDAVMAMDVLAETTEWKKWFHHSRIELLKKVLRRSVAWWVDSQRRIFNWSEEEWEMAAQVVLRSRSPEFASRLLKTLTVYPTLDESLARLNMLPVTHALKKLAEKKK